MTHRIPIVALACLALAYAAAVPSADAATIHWKAAASGLWSDAANWDAAVVPGPSDDAWIDLDGTYTVTVGNASVHRLQLGAAAGTQTLQLAHAYLSVYDTLLVWGQGRLDLSGNGTVTGPVTVGGGMVARGGTNRVTDVLRVRAGGTLQIGAYGEALGATDTLLVGNDVSNEGTVTTWGANGRLDLAGLTFHNLPGALLGTTGGALTLEGVLDNAGTVEQSSYNRVILSHPGASHTNSGTLNVDSQGYLMLDGSFQVNGGSLTNSGAIALGYESQLVVRGGGALTLEAGTTIASGGGSILVDGATLRGGALSYDVDLLLRQATAEVTSLDVPRDRFLTLTDLTFTAPLSVEGTLICDGAHVQVDSLVNALTSQVQVSAGTTLELARGLVNHGLLQAQGGDGIVQIDQGALVNAVDAGIVTRDWPLHVRGPLDNRGDVDAHALSLEGEHTHVNSGRITISDGGRLRIGGGGTFDPGGGALLGNGVLEYDTSTVAGGHVVLPVDTRLQDATIACLSLTNPSTHALETAGSCLIPVPVENRGRLRVTGFTYAQDTLITSDSSVVTIEPGAELATFRGVVNRGTIQATDACCTTLPAFLSVLSGALANTATGTLSAQNGWLHLNGMLANDGRIVVGNDLAAEPPQMLVLSGPGPARINRGTIEIHRGDTLLVVSRGLVNQAGATLQGTGIVRMMNDPLENAGRIAPGLGASGAPDYTLRVLGSARLMPTSVVHADVWPVLDRGVLAVSDTLWLGGTLEVALRDGFQPSLGDSFAVIVASRCLDRFVQAACDTFPSACAGAFAATAYPALSGGLLWDTHAWPNLIALLAADSTTGVLLALLQCDVTADGVELRWRFGDPAAYADARVERAPERTGPWQAADVQRRSDGATEVALDRAVAPGERWFYRLVVSSAGGPLVFGPLEAMIGAGVTELAFAPPAPSPTAGATRFEFALPRAAMVRLSLVDVAGREVAVLVDGPHAAGRWQALWSGDLAGQRAPAGVYFARLRADGRELRRRVVVIR